MDGYKAELVITRGDTHMSVFILLDNKIKRWWVNYSLSFLVIVLHFKKKTIDQTEVNRTSFSEHNTPGT